MRKPRNHRLAQFIVQAMANADPPIRTNTDLALRSGLSYAQAGRLRRGDAHNLSREQVSGLHRALGVPREEILAAAGHELDVPEPLADRSAELAAIWPQLDAETKRTILHLARTALALSRSTHSQRAPR